MNEKIFCHKVDLKKELEKVNDWDIKKEDKKLIPTFINAYQLGKITGRIGSNPEGSLSRYIYFLKILLENLKSDNLKDVENFSDSILKDNIRSYNKKTKSYDGKPYALKSKKEILNIAERYLSFKNPDKKANYTSLLKIHLMIKKNDFETISEDNILKLIENIPDMSHNPKFKISKRYLLAVLGSGGLRAEEFHNIRLSDWTMPTGKEMFPKLRIRNQFSKTKGRTISLYDKWVLQPIKDFINFRIAEGIKPEDVLFETTYYGNRNWLQDYSKKILGKSVNYHLFRHSSATRLSSKLNRQQLCIYFGWSFSSSMADLYIERSGVNMEDVEDKFEKVQFEKQQEEIEDLKDLVLQMKSAIEGKTPIPLYPGGEKQLVRFVKTKDLKKFELKENT